MQPDVIAKNFMPFGGGTRQCAGAEFAKVLMTIFLHVLVTTYRYIYMCTRHDPPNHPLTFNLQLF